MLGKSCAFLTCFHVFYVIFLAMKALKSDFAKRVLKDPESARALSGVESRIGDGPENGVKVTVYPVGDDGLRAPPVVVNARFVPKAN